MSKLTKLLNNPELFFVDVVRKKLVMLHDKLDQKSDQMKRPLAKSSIALAIQSDKKNEKESKKTVNQQSMQMTSDSIEKQAQIDTNKIKNMNDKNDIRVILDQINPLSKMELRSERCSIITYDLPYELFCLLESWNDPALYFQFFDLFFLDRKDTLRRKNLEIFCTQYPEDYLNWLCKHFFNLSKYNSILILSDDRLLSQKLAIKAASRVGIPTVFFDFFDSKKDGSLREINEYPSLCTDFYIGSNTNLVGDFGVFCEPHTILSHLNESRKKSKKGILTDLLGFDKSRQTIYLSPSINVLESVKLYRDYARNLVVELVDFSKRRESDVQIIIDGNVFEKILGSDFLESSLIAVDNIYINDFNQFDSFDLMCEADFLFIEDDFCFSLAADSRDFSNCVGRTRLREMNLGIVPALDLFLDGLLPRSSINLYLCSDKDYVSTKKNIKKMFIHALNAVKYETALEKSQYFLKIESDNIIFATEFSDSALNGTHRFLSQLLGAKEIKQSNPKSNNFLELLDIDCFAQWGIKPSATKDWQKRVAKTYGKPVILVEDGFIRSLDIGLSGEPGLSIILDDTTAYYDATQQSRLERLILESSLSQNQIDRARKAINLIVDNKVSKYNHAPDIRLKLGRVGKPKILLIDQRYGDQSVEFGLASEQSFDKMLYDAITNYSNYDILIKQHPDAIKGGKSSYFSDEKLAFARYTDNIIPINFDVNPYSLFSLVEEVFVGTSGMGFEALLAGKKVHCYGAPFYSGWGLTIDHINIARRNQDRSLEVVFYLAYIESSRYYSPILKKVCSIEMVVSDLMALRGW